MDESREIIPIEHEEAATKKADAESGFQTFLREFTMDDMPACPVGMRLLYEFGVSSPTLYPMAEKAGFQAVPAVLERSVKWHAYATHVQACYDCTER